MIWVEVNTLFDTKEHHGEICSLWTLVSLELQPGLVNAMSRFVHGSKVILERLTDATA